MNLLNTLIKYLLKYNYWVKEGITLSLLVVETVKNITFSLKPVNWFALCIMSTSVI